jgi:hypothetical protein
MVRMMRLSLLLSLVSAAQTNARPGAARFDVPFKRRIAGAQCYVRSGANAGDAAFGFPARGPNQALAFTIGPLKNPPGRKTTSLIAVQELPTTSASWSNHEEGKTIFGYGSVVVISNPLCSGCVRISAGHLPYFA